MKPCREALRRPITITYVLILVLLLILPGWRGISASARHALPSTRSAATTAALLQSIREVNYYPAGNNWANMWLHWAPAAIDTDFGRIAALHANTVRIILQPSAIGYPIAEPLALAHLAQIVGLAQSHGLRVHLTLFDHWWDYADVTGSERWVRDVVAPYAHDPRIAFIELRNEVDSTSSAVISWIRQLLPFMRDTSGGIPVTISLSGDQSTTKLRDLLATLSPVTPDFADYHYYGAPELAYSSFVQAQRAAAPLPLYVGETGFSTAASNATAVPGLATSGPALEAYQDFYYRTVQHAADTLGLPPVAVWTLLDFAPHSIQGASPNSREYGFGLFHADGKPKPIVASVEQQFRDGRVGTTFNQGFEDCTYGVPEIWQRLNLSQGLFACDSTVAHSGHSSARMSHTRGIALGAPAFILSPPVAGIVAGAAYTAAVWARGANLTGTTRITLMWYDERARYLGMSASHLLPEQTTAWTRLTVRSIAPPNAAYLQIHLESAANQGAAWFDDVTIVAPHAGSRR